MLDRDELEQIAAVVSEHDLIAITDEVYEHLVFDGLEHVPLATLDGMAERTLTISSLGKTFSVTGWKVGWACGPAPLVAGVRAAKQFLTFAGATPFQHAGAAALRLGDGWYAAFAADLEAKRDHICAGLAGAGFAVAPCQGTYFVNADVGTDAAEFSRELPHRAGVVAIPTSVFSSDPARLKPYLRFAFCKRLGVIDEAAEATLSAQRVSSRIRSTSYALEREPGGLVGVGREHVRRQLGIGHRAGGQRLRQPRHDRRAPGRDPLVQQPRRALLRHQHQPPRVGVGADGTQIGGERAEQVVEVLRKLLQRAQRLAVDERLEQPAQIVEVAVHDRPRDPRPPGDGLDRDGVEAVLDDDRLGRVQQLLAPLLTGHSCGHAHIQVTHS